MKFEESLIIALAEYGEIDSNIALLDNQKKVLRNKIQEWMKLNEVDNYEVKDSNNQVWKIKEDEQSRKSILDWVMLEKVLGDKNKHLIVEKSFSTFTIKKIKTFTSDWLSKN